MCSTEQNMIETNGFNVILQDNIEAKIMDKLLQRSEARVLEMEKKKSEKQSRLTVNEQTEYFNSAFNELRKELICKIHAVQNVDKSILSSYFDEIIKDHQKLQKLLSDSTMFLPTYDIKVSQESLKNMQEDIKRAENSLLPKKKFAFRTKAKVEKYLHELPESMSSSTYEVSELSNCDVHNLSNQTVEKFNVDIDKMDVGLHALRSCKVYLYGTPSTMFISGLTGCEVFSGPVSTSIYIENCNDCTFFIACQQLRVHSSLKCTFHLHVTCRSIIEDCTSFQFGPYTWSYLNQDVDFENSGLSKKINNWKIVDDFNWLVSGVPSPNWSILCEEELINE